MSDYKGDRALDRRLALALGLVECDGWRDYNFGSAGGPALVKSCGHGDKACFPSREQPTMGGILGGPPQYSGRLEAAFELESLLIDRMLAARYGGFLLAELTRPAGEPLDQSTEVTQIAHASALQRARAALNVLENKAGP